MKEKRLAVFKKYLNEHDYNTKNTPFNIIVIVNSNKEEHCFECHSNIAKK